MRIIPSLRERLGDSLVAIKERDPKLKWMEDSAFVLLVTTAVEDALRRARPTPEKS